MTRNEALFASEAAHRIPFVTKEAQNNFSRSHFEHHIKAIDFMCNPETISEQEHLALQYSENKFLLMKQLLQVLGSPTKEEIFAMNQNYKEFKFPNVKRMPWEKVSVVK